MATQSEGFVLYQSYGSDEGTFITNRAIYLVEADVIAVCEYLNAILAPFQPPDFYNEKNVKELGWEALALIREVDPMQTEPFFSNIEYSYDKLVVR
jgi:hypothetical protein